jgi:hypothetical protein
MALSKSFAAVAILSSLTMAAPAFAQAVPRTRGGGGGQHGGDGGGNRGGGRVERSAPAPQPAAPSGPSRAETYRGGRPDGRSYDGRSYNGGRSYSGPVYHGGRSYSGPVAVPRTPRYYNNYGYNNRYYNAPRYYSNGRYYSYSPRYYGRGYYTPRVYGPVYRSYGYRYYGYPSYVYRPYIFRSHFSIGFGFFAGYAVPYSYSYPLYYPVAVPYPVPYPSYGYPATPDPSYQPDPNYYQGSVSVAPGPTTAGGVTFEVNPPTAQVYADGQYVGTVETFDGSKQPLTLAAGQHRIELRADGFETVTFDVTVVAGQVIPYRGDLRQY